MFFLLPFCLIHKRCFSLIEDLFLLRRTGNRFVFGGRLPIYVDVDEKVVHRLTYLVVAVVWQLLYGPIVDRVAIRVLLNITIFYKLWAASRIRPSCNVCFICYCSNFCSLFFLRFNLFYAEVFGGLETIFRLRLIFEQNHIEELLVDGSFVFTGLFFSIDDCLTNLLTVFVANKDL